MKKIMLGIFVVPLIAILGYFYIKSNQSTPLTEVNVYSHRHYEADKQLFAEFTRQTGIQINVVKAKADQLFQRLKSEKANSPADLFITADAGRLARAKAEGLLQSVTSQKLQKQVPSYLKDSENQWYAFTIRARVIAYAKDRISSKNLSSYTDLAKPKWKGKILIRSSSNIYNQSLLASMIAKQGVPASKSWAKGIYRNLAREPKGSDRDQMRAVAAGIADLAIVNSYYLGLLANSTNPSDQKVASKIGLFFPNPTHINISGGGVTKHAKNKKNAIKLLEFLTSAQSQAVFPKTTYEYPLDLSPSLQSDLLKSWGTFNPDRLPLEKLGQYNFEAQSIFSEVGWK